MGRTVSWILLSAASSLLVSGSAWAERDCYSHAGTNYWFTIGDGFAWTEWDGAT